MLKFWNKRVRSEETVVVLTLGFVLAVNSFATQLSGIVSVSGFIGQVGVREVLWLWVIANLAVVALAGVQSRLMDQPDRMRTMRRVVMAFAVLFLLLRLLFFVEGPDWLRYGVLYLISDQQWLWFPVLFWVMASDFFNVTRTRQLFPILSAFGLAGELLGILTAALSPSTSPFTPWLLVLNAALYGLAFFGLGYLRRKGYQTTPNPVRIPTETKRWKDSLEFITEIPAFRFLFLGVIPIMICDTVIEYHFLSSSAAAITDPVAYQRFYSLYRFVLTCSALIVQAVISNRLLTRLSLPNALLIYPIALLGISFSFLLSPLFPLSWLGIWLMKLIRDTVYLSARKALLTLIPDDNRGRVSLIVENLLVGVSTGVWSLVMAGMVFIGFFAGAIPMLYLGISTVAGGLAVGAGLQVRKTYDASLLNWRLKRKKDRTKALDRIKQSLLD
ncbi:MAG: hypothetical protein IAE83_08940 [Anaerolinea sp.]|nr:hypothetical protein [Anaerolinea sp.]MCC6974543.1 hypothetical protein [Anaerolineae bacterium]